MGLKVALWDTLLEALKCHTSPVVASWSLRGQWVRDGGTALSLPAEMLAAGGQEKKGHAEED